MALSVKYTPHFLHRLEDIFTESQFILRYEKGNFKSGYCVLKEDGLVMVNAYYPLEGKINSLIEVLRANPPEEARLSDKNKKLLKEILAETPAEEPGLPFGDGNSASNKA
ncbi:MAG: hypothetical protein V4543_08250 [Bacteroidota bacterium]